MGTSSTRTESACERIPRGLLGVSEHKRDVLFFLRIEDSPQLAAESFNTLLHCIKNINRHACLNQEIKRDECALETLDLLPDEQ
jgi:hypothetical protein